jgi:hypothetical protein
MSSPLELVLHHRAGARHRPCPRRHACPAGPPPPLPCLTPAANALLDHRRRRPASPAPALPCLPRADQLRRWRPSAWGGRAHGGRARQPARGGALGQLGVGPGPTTLGAVRASSSGGHGPRRASSSGGPWGWGASAGVAGRVAGELGSHLGARPGPTTWGGAGELQRRPWSAAA